MSRAVIRLDNPGKGTSFYTVDTLLAQIRFQYFKIFSDNKQNNVVRRSLFFSLFIAVISVNSQKISPFTQKGGLFMSVRMV